MKLLKLFPLSVAFLLLCAFYPGIIGNMSVCPFQAPGWTVIAGAWSTTPTLATDVVTNGTMEVDANWSNYSTPATNERSNEQAHGGTYSRKVVTTGTGAKGIQQTFSPALSGWYSITFWAYTVGASAINAQIGSVVIGSTLTTSGAWKSFTTEKLLSASTPIILYHTAAETFYLDDVVVKPLNLATCLAIRNYNKQVGFKAAVTLTYPHGGGVAARVAGDLSSGVIGYRDTSKAYLLTWNGTTWTTLISATSTYVSGQVIEIRWADANTAQLYYNNAQVGTNQDVSAIPAGDWAGIFSTYSTVSLSSPTPLF